MTSTAAPSVPVVPPRPDRSRDREGNAPTVPTRPAKRLSRPITPNPDRFAPSPLLQSFFDSGSKRISQSFLGDEVEAMSLDMPGVGEEGQEYAALISSPEMSRSASPEQTRIVGEDLKLHAPKPTVPAASAKQRVSIVTHTDSARAAAFGFGPSNEEPPVSGASSLKKKASTTSQLSHYSEVHADPGIPEIGQRVPMLAFAGDVQAPSPAPPRATSVDSSKHAASHIRRTSSRGGFHDNPPGSYGLRGHGVESTDRLEKAYYEKHPEIYQKEQLHKLHDRVHDYSMSSENLNKIVRDTASRGVGLGASELDGTPSEQVGFEVSDEYVMRATTPLPPSADPKTAHESGKEADDAVPVDVTGQQDNIVKHNSNESSQDHRASTDGACPILAPDEVAKDESRGRPSSRPTSTYSSQPPEIHSTPLEDVEEYEPLFPEDDKGEQKPKTAADKLKARQRFPSQDIWEDAPNSVHSTAEVLTPEIDDISKPADSPLRDAKTPAQEFARRQEELAEREALNPDSFLNRQQRPEIRVENQPHVPKEIHKRPSMPPRFPSRDIWEDTPDSLQFTTTVSRPQSPDNSTNDEVMKSPVANKKPTVPVRPPKKQNLGDDLKPIVPNRPKPQIPARPAKPAVDSKPVEGGAKQKPVVPARPMGSKIAALQAGFMSDLNNRLRLGPQAPKKEATTEETAEEAKPAAPLVDARKGRARGPQRRAPTSQGSDGTSEQSGQPSASSGQPVLSFSMTRTLWSIDEEGTMTVDEFGPVKAKGSGIIAEKAVSDEAEVSEANAEETKAEAVEETQSKEVEAVETKAQEVLGEKDIVSKNEEHDREADKFEVKAEETKTEDDKLEDEVEEAKSEEHTTQEHVVEEHKGHEHEDKREEQQQQHAKIEESESETSVNKTPDSSEALDLVEGTKPAATHAAGESVSAEHAGHKDEADESKDL